MEKIKKKHTNVEVVMSVSGIRKLIEWLETLMKVYDKDETLRDYVGFLRQVVRYRDDQD